MNFTINRDHLFSAIKKSSLSFALVNLFSISIIFIFYPIIVKSRGFTVNISLIDGADAYFKFFYAELFILIFSVFLSTSISAIIISIIVRLKNYSLLKPFINPWSYFLLYIIPIALFQLSGIEMTYNQNNPRLFRSYLFILIILSYYTILMIIRGFASLSINDESSIENLHLTYPLVMINKRAPAIINIIILITYYFGIPSTGTTFINEPSLHSITSEPVSLHIAIFVFSLQILILQLIISFPNSKLSSPLSFPEKILYSDRREKLSKIKRIIIIPLVVIIIFITLIQLIISLIPVILVTGNYEWIFFIRNPYYSNWGFANKAPDFSFLFGTDLNAHDIFSMIIFSLSSLLFISYIISIIRFRIALDFNKITDKIILKSKKQDMYQIFSNFPNIPLLVIISILLFPIKNWFAFYLLLLSIMSIYSWIPISEILEDNQSIMTKEKGGIFNKLFHPIIMQTMSIILIDLTILSYFMISRGYVVSIGRILLDAQNNFPQTYWWGWAFPLFSIVFVISLLRSNK